MDFGEFSDVSLDTNDSTNFKSCDDTVSDIEDSGIWTNNTNGRESLLLNFNYQHRQQVQQDHNFRITDDDNDKNASKASASSDLLKYDGGSPTNSPHKTEDTSSHNGPTSDSNSFYRQSSEMQMRSSNGSPNEKTLMNVLTNSDTNSAYHLPPSRKSSECDSDSPALSVASQSYTETGSVGEISDDTDSNFQIHQQLEKQSSRNSIDELLFDLYDKHGGSSSRNSIYSIDGSSTDCSSLSEYQLVKSDTEAERLKYTASTLEEQAIADLKELVLELSNNVNQRNAQLVKCLRNRERHRTKKAKHCDMITAILQAWSNKSSSDAKMKFTIEPVAGETNFEQWRDAIGSLVRRPVGLPSHFRSKVWLALATRYIDSLHIDWNRVVQFAFNDRCNPDDDALGAQIVKDLHRTGCSSFSGIENEEDRVILQRVLLGYARWNKVTGYCQGFNILAAFILNVTNKNEVDALKVMVYVVDHMLPKEYFAHNLRALTVDMAVFRNYLSMKLPKLSAHLTKLQRDACDDSTGVNVEPPLTNVFTMQWFLTMFATCLPMETVLKIWDCVVIDGSEILIRTALALWTKLAKRVIRAKSADKFYVSMGTLTQELMAGKILSSEDLIRSIYNMAPIPLPKLAELREKYMYDITPFSAAINSASHKAAYGEEESSDYLHELTRKEGDARNKTFHSMDVALLKKQYSKLTHRQRQARLLMKATVTTQPAKIIPSNMSPVAINHLFVGKQLSEKKVVSEAARARQMMRSRSVDDGSIKAQTPSLTSDLSTRLDLYATTQQGNRQTLKYKVRKSKPTVSPAASSQLSTPSAQSEKEAADMRLEAAIKEGLERKSIVSVSSNTDDEGEGDGGNLTGRSRVCRMSSIDSVSSSFTNDSVFARDSPTHRRSSIPALEVNKRQQSLEHSPRPPNERKSSGFTSPTKVFNPFPKQATGLLSAEKAQIGVRLGLYKPQDAIKYMTPSERRKFLKDDKNFIGRMAMTSKSSMW